MDMDQKYLYKGKRPADMHICWFGPASWGAPVCAPDHRLDVPVGKTCWYCEKRIGPESEGLVDSSGAILHLSCMLRMVDAPF